MKENSISQRLKEINEEINTLYQEKRALEMEQQRYWEEMGWTGPIIAMAEDVPIAWMADSEDNLDNRFGAYGNID
jgi:hypothetical protein